VGANTITVLSSPITGIDGIYNPNATSGGTDSQSNTTVAQEIQSRSQGGLGTPGSYLTAVLNNFSVQDVSVVTAKTQSIFPRNQFGGSVDIAILNLSTVSVTDVDPYVSPILTTYLIPSTLPLVSVTSITGFDASANPITLSGPANGVGTGIDYDVVLDTTGPFAGSSQETSRIVLHPTANVPGNNTLLTVVYNNNQLVNVIQAFFNNPSNSIIGSDVLVKAAVRIGAMVTGNIRVIPGYTSSTVQAAAITAVQSFFSALGIGTEIEPSQIIAAIEAVPGVEFVDIPSFSLAYTSNPLVPVQQIIPTAEQFVGLDSVTVGFI
jgi:hypothetical protein